MGMLSAGEFAMFCLISLIAGMAIDNAIGKNWKRAIMLSIPVVVNLVVFAVRHMWS